MADSINCVTISGNLTRDAEVRPSVSTNIIKFGMAVNERKRDGSTGEWTDYANFIDVTQFMTDAQMQAFFHGYEKGARAVVHGKLHYNAWEKDGQKRSKIEVVADVVEVIGRSKTIGTPHPAQQSFTASAPQAATPAAQVYGEDIPF